MSTFGFETLYCNFCSLNKTALGILFLLMSLVACGSGDEFTTTSSSASPPTPATGVALTVTANACVGGAVENVNVYLTSGNLQFHGHTDATGSLTLPQPANTMPADTYSLNVLGPQGMKCYPTADCNTSMPATVDVPGTLAVYCR